jgi:glycyl-tRNA synthetase beta chain
VVPGAALAEGLQKALHDALAKLPIPKVMQYQLHGAGAAQPGWTSVHFVRPAHSLVALHGAEVVPVTALGLQAGRTTRGHRFEAALPVVEIAHADAYAATLREQGAVIASFAERRAEVARQLAAAAAHEGLKPIDDDALLDEVTALVERPNVLVCRFEPEFLAVPPECLILTMKANQKYFPLLDAEGRLTERFLVVSNIRPADPRHIVGGNERVVRPRLADAKFFFDQDRKRTLASRVPLLDKVVYHAKLGTQGDRVRRLRLLARWIAERIGADPYLADRAAELAKADLLTDMVGEFPELQGVMGGYYAAHDGEDTAVVQAVRDQYVARRADAAQQEESPSSLVGAALQLADRAETIVGMWSVGSKPTGDKDPFAIRRHTLAIIGELEALAVARSLDRPGTVTLTLQALLAKAAESFAPHGIAPAVLEEIEDYFYERFNSRVGFLFSTQQIASVVQLRPPIHEVTKRLYAVKDFTALPEAQALAAANKRINNILKKSDEPAASVLPSLLVEPAERALNAALGTVAPQADAMFDAGNYAASLQALAVLKAPVDAFFDAVMVNADDPALRRNRLALLAQLHAAMNRVADLSRLAA